MFAFRYSLDAYQNGGLHLANAGDTSGDEWAWPWSGSPSAASEFPDVIGDDRLRRQGPHHLDHHNAGTKQGNRKLHFARAVHSRHPLPPIGDAAYRQHAGGGPSHGHRQHAQTNLEKSLLWFWRCLRGQRDRQTHRQTYSSQNFTTAPAGEVINARVSIWIAVKAPSARRRRENREWGGVRGGVSPPQPTRESREAS